MIAAISMVMTVGMSGLVIDIANARQMSRGAQASADAAALAGAQEVANGSSWSAVVASVKRYVQANSRTTDAAWVGCSDIDAFAQFPGTAYFPDSGNGNRCISSDSPSTATQLRVKLPDAVISTSFGAVFGVKSLNVSRTATATVASASAVPVSTTAAPVTSTTTPSATTTTTSFVPQPIRPPCVLCVFDPTGTSLDFIGSSSSLQVTNNGYGSGGISLNSTASVAFRGIGSASSVSTSKFDVAGNYNVISMSVSPAPTTGTSAVGDPLASLPAPNVSAPSSGNSCSSGVNSFGYASTGATVSIIASSATCSFVPGLYSSISIRGSSNTLNFAPGIYVFKSSLSLAASSSTLNAPSSLMYFACSSYPTPCSSGQSGAGFDFTASSSQLNVSPPSSGSYAGLSIYFDRLNESALRIIGSSLTGFSGSVYAPSSELEFTGSSGSVTVPSMILVGNMRYTASSTTIRLSYNPTSNISLGYTTPPPMTPTTTIAVPPTTTSTTTTTGVPRRLALLH